MVAYIIIVVCVLITLNVLIVALALYYGKMNRQADGVYDNYYNEEGDHIYYDRELIRHKQQQQQQQSATTKNPKQIIKGSVTPTTKIQGS